MTSCTLSARKIGSRRARSRMAAARREGMSTQVYGVWWKKTMRQVAFWCAVRSLFRQEDRLQASAQPYGRGAARGDVHASIRGMVEEDDAPGRLLVCGQVALQPCILGCIF